MTSEHRNYHDSKFVHNIRLWGADAQQRLEQSHLMVLGCTATACQMVKSLVLPGASTFTLVDGRERADAATLQSNFFAFDDESTGLDDLSVAERCRRGLSLLHLPSNHTKGVVGTAITKCPNAFIESGEFAAYVQDKKVTFVILTQLVSRKNMAAAARVLEARCIMSTVLTVSGFVGAARFHSVNPIFIVETRSDMNFVDLRTRNPFPALLEWFEQHDPVAAVGTPSLQYIPWMCLIFHALRIWRKQAGVEDQLALPATMALWKPVKDIITSWFDEKAENCEEALLNCKGSLDLRKTQLTSTTKAVAVAKGLIERAAVPDGCVVPFILVGLQAFRDAHDGSIPLRNKLVDFHTNTESYVRLSDLYKAQAAAEAAEVHKYAVDALTAYGWSAQQLPLSVVSSVCSNTPWDMGAIEWTPLAAELEAPPAGKGWYAALGSCHAYAGDAAQFPGSQVDADVDAVVASVKAASADGLEDYLSEVVRGGGYEPIATACLLGSAAAEEAIKMIQERMVPTRDALVYDGHHQTVTAVTL